MSECEKSKRAEKKPIHESFCNKFEETKGNVADITLDHGGSLNYMRDGPKEGSEIGEESWAAPDYKRKLSNWEQQLF